MSDGSMDASSEIDPLADKEKDLRAKHGDIVRVNTKRGTMMFRKATRAEFRKYMTMQGSGPSEKSQAMEWLSRVTAIYPENGGYEALLDNLPGIYLQAAKQISIVCGMADEDDEKK